VLAAAPGATTTPARAAPPADGPAPFMALTQHSWIEKRTEKVEKIPLGVDSPIAATHFQYILMASFEPAAGTVPARAGGGGGGGGGGGRVRQSPGQDGAGGVDR